MQSQNKYIIKLYHDAAVCMDFRCMRPESAYASTIHMHRYIDICIDILTYALVCVTYTLLPGFRGNNGKSGNKDGSAI